MLHNKVRARPEHGPAFLSYGFRPFFFLGALYAALNILFWLPFYFAEIEIPIVVGTVDWHVHELLFGVLPAVIAGFLLTAIPNWTGRLPVKGTPLLLLVVIWLAGRIAFNFSAYFGLTVTAFVDSAFLLIFFGAVAIEIIAGKNWRNARVLALIGILAAGNIAFYVEVSLFGEASISRRVGITAITLLVMLIGGRIIPSFTRNWLARMKPGRLPTPFSKLDKVALGFSIITLAGWSIWPESIFVGYLFLLAAAANLVRLSRWAGDRIIGCYLLLILHLAYLFLPIGFALIGAHILWPGQISAAAGIHAVGMGGFGSMILGVMVRTTRGHTGNDLKTDFGAQLAFTTILLASSLRVLVALDLFGDFSQILLRTAQFGWSFAFLSFAVFYAPKLWGARRNKA
ncbi:NnrS family protein [Maritalea sp.]|jgi:uncharacterized protein involved in response to NO|uniref:NnrS family protein n=1 Tax=Maritalea sp. TaxID=2003361 RepID=UPI0039E6D1E9